MTKILIKKGKIAADGRVFVGDLMIENECISQIGKSIDSDADVVIDAEGKYVLPGGVDEHVHYDYEYGGQRVRGYETSAAALMGGTTTIADFMNNDYGSTVAEAISEYEKKVVNGSACCDYVLHYNIKKFDEKTPENISKLADNGLSTINLFMFDCGKENFVKDDEILQLLQTAGEHGITPFIHAENCDISNYLVEQLRKNDMTEPKYHAKARPDLIEAESTNRIGIYAQITDTPILVTHISSLAAMEVVEWFYNNGTAVFAETCPQYLVLDSNYLQLPPEISVGYICNPPLRENEDVKYLWRSLDEGTVLCVGTDHCAFSLEKQKTACGFDHSLVPKGVPGLQDRLSLLWSFGVQKSRISVEKLVEVFAENPAKVLGIYPQKGTLQKGSDADIVIYDPDAKDKFKNEDSYHGIDYNAYEGMVKYGAVDTVLLRGKIMVAGGKPADIQSSGGKRVQAKPFAYCYQNVKL